MPATELLAKLKRAGLTIAVAESCTGGRICDWITDVPGSSEHFKGGVVAYSNDSKERLLGVSRGTLKEHGAVSEACALEMAVGVAKAFGADLGLSITGIAGPGGGSAAKPVGLVYAGVVWRKEQAAFRMMFDGDRDSIKQQAARQAIGLIMDFLG